MLPPWPLSTNNSLIAVLQKRRQQVAEHGNVRVHLGRKSCPKAKMMAAGAHPQGRQQQYRGRQPLLHSLRHGGHQQGIGKGRQVRAVLLASRDRRKDHRLVSRHLAQQRPGQVVESHGWPFVNALAVSPTARHTPSLRWESQRKTGNLGRRRRMGKPHANRMTWAAIGLVLAGCSRQDPERLARVGARVGQKAEAALAGNDGRLLRGWQSIRGEIALDARVMARLSSDKLLAKRTISVQVSGGEVQLQGKVENIDQRRGRDPAD